MVLLSFASSVLPILSFSVPAPLKHFMKCQKPFMVIMVSTNRSTDSWHSLQRVELILLPQSMTGLNDLLPMNRVRKKWRCVPSVVCHQRHGGFLLALPWIESLTLGKTAAMVCEHASSPVESSRRQGTEASSQHGRHGRELLEGGTPAPVQPSDDTAPVDNLTATSWETLSQNHPASLLLDFLRTVQDNTRFLF